MDSGLVWLADCFSIGIITPFAFYKESTLDSRIVRLKCGVWNWIFGNNKKGPFFRKSIEQKGGFLLVVVFPSLFSRTFLCLFFLSRWVSDTLLEKKGEACMIMGWFRPVSTKHCLWEGEGCFPSSYHLLSPSSFVSPHHLLSGVSGGSIADFLFFFSLFFPFCLEILCTMITDTQDETNFF